MRTRIAAMVLLLAMLVLVLSACGHEGKTERYNPFEGRFEKYWVDIYTYVLVDLETGVCYLDGESHRVLLNADGTIATWEGE